jgi:23S rRNA (cytidine1920-2'-O)/16S rRNA (cytidine1409-2'-O)-methyltransferase
VEGDCEVEVTQTEDYASRGALKLEKALDTFNISPQGRVCIDCGASTGGFTDCLLRRGAQKVYAVDVGFGQLIERLRTDSRVVVMERTNVRDLTPADVPDKPSLAVIDVSFISLRLVLPPVRALLDEGGEAICLIKPQFEAGRENVGKKGIVKSRAVHEKVLRRWMDDACGAGFSVAGLTYSPITGSNGNIEFLGYLTTKEADGLPIRPEEVVSAAHAALATAP